MPKFRVEPVWLFCFSISFPFLFFSVNFGFLLCAFWMNFRLVSGAFSSFISHSGNGICWARWFARWSSQFSKQREPYILLHQRWSHIWYWSVLILVVFFFIIIIILLFGNFSQPLCVIWCVKFRASGEIVWSFPYTRTNTHKWILAKGLRTHILTRTQMSDVMHVEYHWVVFRVFFFSFNPIIRLRLERKISSSLFASSVLFYFNETERENEHFYRHNIRSYLFLIEYLMDL